MTLWNILLTALRGVATNKLRSALTMLGVIIGVASVIAMLALGNGARAAVEASFRFLGANQVQIRQNTQFEDGQLVPKGKILSYEDGLSMPAQVGLVDRVSMSISRVTKVRRGRTVLDMSVTGSTSGVLFEMVSGGQGYCPIVLRVIRLQPGEQTNHHYQSASSQQTSSGSVPSQAATRQRPAPYRWAPH